MATAVNGLGQGQMSALDGRLMPTARLFGWMILVAASAYFFVDAVTPYFTWAEQSYGGFWPRASWLLVHVIAGTVALAAGPVQFWIAQRRGLRTMHRWTGRLYLVGVLLGAATGLYLSWFTYPRAFGAGLLALDLAWLSSTFIAWRAIRNRDIARHREWMIRSYVLTLAFVSFRFWVMLAMMWQLAEPLTVISVAGWLSWIVPLLIVELLLRRRTARA